MYEKNSRLVNNTVGECDIFAAKKILSRVEAMCAEKADKIINNKIIHQCYYGQGCNNSLTGA